MKMTRLSIRIGCAVLGLLFAASAVHAADSCLAPCLKLPNKARHVSTAIPLPAGVGVLLTTPGATLKKGVHKRVVVVEATMTTGVPAPLAPSAVLTMLANLNGVVMEPAGAGLGVVADCGGTGMSGLPPMAGCTLSATFWLDLDQAETASPGTFIGMPLTVTLKGGDAALVGGLPAFVSMAVRQEQKY